MLGGGMTPVPPRSRPRTPTSRRRSSLTGRSRTRVMKASDAWLLEDEPRLGSVGAREDYPRAAVVPIRVIVRIIEHHDPKAHAGVIVGAPVRVTHVAVA